MQMSPHLQRPLSSGKDWCVLVCSFGKLFNMKSVKRREQKEVEEILFTMFHGAAHFICASVLLQ